MVTHAESSEPSVNERLARARHEDLRRCRNLQAKLARAQLHDDAQDLTVTPTQRLVPHHAPSSSRTGLLFLSSTQQAQREHEQRTRERQLKRQVAGPIPPHSWRGDFERLSVRTGAAHLDRRRVQDLVAVRDDADSSAPKEDAHRDRRRAAAVCAALRHHLDDSAPKLGLRDMTLCVIADALNRPAPVSKRKVNGVGVVADMDRVQIREVLEYLPRHMRDRMMALCGRLAATEWPLSEWTAQAIVDIDRCNGADLERGVGDGDEADDDWEDSINSDAYPYSVHSSSARDASTALDLSFATVSPRTIQRMLSSPTAAVSLTTLSLAGFNSSSSTTTALDSPHMHAIFARLPNLRLLSLAGTRLSLSDAAEEEDGGQRAGVFLRKLSRSLAKLEVLDLGHCAWVSAEALLAVSWAAGAWPRMERLLLGGCAAVLDPREQRDDGVVFAGEVAGSYVGPWHAEHSQRAMAHSNQATTGTQVEADTLLRDPFDAFSSSTQQRSSTRATFSDYVTDALQPAIIAHMTPLPQSDAAAGSGEGVLMEYVRCPRSTGKVELWQWQRARILDAVRGRAAPPSSRQRPWIDVYF